MKKLVIFAFCLSSVLISNVGYSKSIEELKAEIAAIKKKRAEISQRSQRTEEGEEKKLTVLNRNKKIDLSQFSHLIQIGGIWTLANKSSFIHIPPHLKDKLVKKPTGKHIPFADFIKQSRGIVKTYELTKAQSYDGEAILLEEWERLTNLGTIVVATHNGIPSPFVKPEVPIVKK